MIDVVPQYWESPPQPFPADETWCWLTDGQRIWIGKRDRTCSGGWTNEDTWEDFDGVVKAWFPIEQPDLPGPDGL